LAGAAPFGEDLTVVVVGGDFLCKVLLNLGGDVTIQSFPFGTICYLDPSGTRHDKPSHIPSHNPQRTRRDVPRAPRGSWT
jgi:hypothetical protein